MWILSAQVAMSLAVLAFAMVALRVGGALPAHARRYAYAWTFTGWAFLLEGFNSLFHDAFAIVAFTAGPASSAWAAVLRWHPVLNHSRTFLLTTYCVVLLVALQRIARHRQPPQVPAALGLVCIGMLAGAVVGWNEASFSGITHFSAVAIFDIMELVALMALLLIGLVGGGMDRSLWIAISVNGFILALSVLLFAAISRIDFAGQWSPRPLQMQWTKAVLHIAMVVIAWRHLNAIRKGRPVRGLMEAPVRSPGMPSLDV